MKFQSFNQSPPELGNQFDDDAVLRSYLKRILPAEFLGPITEDLHDMGKECAKLDALSHADRLNEPVLTQWDAWGERVDHIELTDTWKAAEKVAAKKGVVAAAYEDTYGKLARVHQFSLAYLFGPASDFFSCPLAMTDGAARTLLASGNERIIERAVPHLTSRDPDEFWTSGQWMTESTGGSDVGRSETVAVETDGAWTLSGRKWFTSAASSQIAVTLGRPEGNGPGGHGLALFYLECDDQRGKTILVNRLKDKLGTRKLPTAELTLDDAPAELVLGTTGGVKGITPMLNVTRTWNAISAVSLMRRGLALAKSYAKKRIAFGATLDQQPLHMDTLATLSAEFEGAFLLAFRVTELLGEGEKSTDDGESALLRAITPIAKLTTGRQVVRITSEVLEAFGGAGYVEDTGLPRLLRDAQVLSIWEGTTNVLALDLLRAISRGDSLEALGGELRRCQEAVAARSLTPDHKAELDALLGQAMKMFTDAVHWVKESQTDRATLEGGARRFALTLGHALELALLCEHAAWELAQGDGPSRARAAARRFANLPLHRICATDPEEVALLAR